MIDFQQFNFAKSNVLAVFTVIEKNGELICEETLNSDKITENCFIDLFEEFHRCNVTDSKKSKHTNLLTTLQY